MFVPPLAQTDALSFLIQSDDKDSIQLSSELLRNDYEGSPPSGDSMFWRQREDLVPKLNGFFCLRHMRPVFENGRPTAHRVDKRSDLVSTVFRIKRGCGFGITRLPGAAVLVHPSCKDFSCHAYRFSLKACLPRCSTFAQSCTAFHS